MCPELLQVIVLRAISNKYKFLFQYLGLNVIFCSNSTKYKQAVSNKITHNYFK